MVREPVFTRLPAKLEEKEEFSGTATISPSEHVWTSERNPTFANQAVHRLQNSIPGEVITFWAGIQGAINIAGETPPSNILWGLMIFGIISTPVYVFLSVSYRGDNEFELMNIVSQSLLATGAFVVWVYYLGGPFRIAGYYSQLYSTILIFTYPLFVVVIPFYMSLVLWMLLQGTKKLANVLNG